MRRPASAAERGRTLVALLALLLIAWAAHWHTFGVSELGQDGFLSADLAWGPLPAMLTFTAHDVHPPLFFALLHWWFALAGMHYLTAKFLPIAGSMLALALLYQIGARLAGRAVGLLGAGLLLVSSSALLLAPTVRPFTLALCCSLLTLVITLLSLRSGLPVARRRLLWLALALSTALALLAWYLQPFFLVLEALLLSRSPAGGRVRAAASWPWLGALAAGCLLASPWYAYVLPLLWSKLHAGVDVVGTAPTLPALPALAAGFARGVVGRSGGMLTALAVAGWLVGLVIGLRWCRRCSSDPVLTRADVSSPATRRLATLALPPGLFLGSAEVLAILLRWQHPDAFGRYLIGILPFVVLLQSIAVLKGPPALRCLALVALLLAVAGQLSWYAGLVRGTAIDWDNDPVFAALADKTQAGDGLLFSDHARRAQYELNRRFFKPLPAAVIQTAGDTYLGATPQQAEQTVAGLVPKVHRIWYLESAELPATPGIGRAALAQQAYVLSVRHVADTDVQLFLTQPPTAQRQLAVTLDQAVTLQSAAYTATTSPGGAVTVRLLWRDEHPLAQSYSVFVHLDSAAGTLVAQHDGIPVAGLRPTNTWHPGETVDDHHALELPPDVPAGDYRLDVGLYQGQQRLSLPDGTNQVTIGVVHVARPA